MLVSLGIHSYQTPQKGKYEAKVSNTLKMGSGYAYGLPNRNKFYITICSKKLQEQAKSAFFCPFFQTNAEINVQKESFPLWT